MTCCAPRPGLTTFTLNGKPVTVHSDPTTPLLDVLRGELNLTGTKQGCDHEGECGACTVLLDGAPVRSCLTPLGKVAGRAVQTVEGLGNAGHLHPLQVAFIETGAVQCGFCTPGMLMAAKSLLDHDPDPSRARIIEALAGNLCRCTGYHKIVQAIQLAAARLRGADIAPPFPPAESVIGGDVLRADSIPKVTGQARYVEDMTMPGMLRGRVLRSPHPHARLVALDTAPAARLPGVACVLTAADIPGLNSFADYSRDEPLLPPVGAALRMVGAPVALVAADTDAAAQAALDAVEVVYAPLPHVYEPDEALQAGAVPIAGEGNVLNSFAVQYGALEAAFDEADIVLETTYRTAFLEHAALERESLLGFYDEAGRLTVTGGTHEPFHQQMYIAEMLGLPPDKVRVVVPPTGGSFGGKQDPWPFLATALMVYYTRRPVRLVYSRRESFDASPKRHPYLVTYRVGAARDGRLTGAHLRIDCNTGGYDAHGQYIANYAVTAAGGPYRWPAFDGAARVVYTNGPKAGQYRGFGTAQSTFALECTLDELSQALGIDPIDFRLQNALHQADITFLGYPVAETLGYQETLEAVQPFYQAWQQEAEAINANAGAGPVRLGVGVAGMWYRFGKSGALKIEAHAELTTGGELVVYCSAPDYGQGTATVMSQLAAEALGVPRAAVTVVNADTAFVPDSGIQGASRATYFVGGAVTQAATLLRRAIIGVAAEVLDAHPDALTLREGGVIVAQEPARSLRLAEVAQEFDRIGKPRRLAGYFDLAPHFPAASRPEYVPLFVTGAHVAQAAVNCKTGAVRVLKMVAAHDVGRVVNRPDAEGQIEGAMVMGLGAALLEEIVPGASAGFGDYYLPTAQSMPEMHVILVEVPGRHGPHGVKGLGEAAMLPATPAIINAASRAIGARLRTLPATPERVLKAIRTTPDVGP
ncbi:MAG: molybdopterin-dependent oxidoreductase [Anaerolineae bacterium]|nr:molybdopterin-dependent oxidoreductase [Anaerolineae bacterium]